MHGRSRYNGKRAEKRPFLQFNKVMVIMSETWLTTQEAADFSGYHVNYIRQIIRAKKIKARKFGPVWQGSKESLQTYLQTAEKSDDKRLGPK